MSLLERLAQRFKRQSADTGSTQELPAVDGPASETAERRKHMRHSFGAPTMVVFPGDRSGVRAFIRDISKGGCLFDTEAPVGVGAAVSLAFLSRPRGHCHAVGKVVRTAGPTSFGVEFSKVNMAFLGFVGTLGDTSPDSRAQLLSAMSGSTVEVLSSAS
jgi:hypothetical protein